MKTPKNVFYQVKKTKKAPASQERRRNFFGGVLYLASLTRVASDWTSTGPRSTYFLENGTSGKMGRLDYVFGLFCFFVRIHQLATRINQARRHEDDQVPFDVLFRVRAEETADDWDVTQER